ncbi:hypothetical protein PMAYCL1PPCAC_10944, partial [Pristionchus mayeri]
CYNGDWISTAMDIDVDLTKRMTGNTSCVKPKACSVPPLTFIDLPCPVTVSTCELPYRIFELIDSGINVKLRCRFNGKLHDQSGNPIDEDVVCNSTTGAWKTNSGNTIYAAFCAG